VAKLADWACSRFGGIASLNPRLLPLLGLQIKSRN